MFKRKNKKRKLNKIFFGINILLSIIFLVFIFLINAIPTKYLVLITICLVIWNIIIAFLLLSKEKKKRNKVGYILSSLFIIIIGIIGYYLNTTYSLLSLLGKDNYRTETFLILVKNESNYEKLDDLNDENIGYVPNEMTSINKALDKLNKQINIENVEYEEYSSAFDDLTNEEISSILIEESNYNIYLEEHPEYNDLFRVLDKIIIKTKINNKNSNINVTEDTFTVLISGIDTYGEIDAVGRSDVNMLVTVNPKTKQILLTSIPRDYYVRLTGTTGYKDKLTHSGIYGIEMTQSTIEDLLDINIDYYFRVNFTTLENVIDSIGGVDVYSQYSFVSYIGNYQFYEGYNHMNGEQALGFARERKSLPNGDTSRAENQQAVIDGIIRKLTSSTIISKYNSLLNSIKNTFQTNMSDSDVTNLIKMQLEDNAKWNITSYVLEGTGAYNYTYSYQGQELYVMEPDTDSISTAHDMINAVADGEKLESSYDEDASNIKNPDKVTPPSNNENNNSNNNTNNNDTSTDNEDTTNDEETTTDPLEPFLPTDDNDNTNDNTNDNEDGGDNNNQNNDEENSSGDNNNNNNDQNNSSGNEPTPPNNGDNQNNSSSQN